MIVTEQEAATKRCQESFGGGWTPPDGRMATMVGASHGQAIVASPYYCIGPACMAWVWEGYRHADGQIDNDDRGDHVGYCGKARR